MTANQIRVAIYILIGLLGLYVAPLVAAAGPALFGTLTGETGPGKLLLMLMTDDGPYGQSSALMTPLIAGLTVATLWSRTNRRWAYTAIAVSVTGVLAAVILWYGLSDPLAAEAMWFRASPGVDSAEAFGILKDRFLGGAIVALATVVGVLLGLRAADTDDGDD
tara:strand:+ start:2799 stop:3290 length:492 start_codon:yes stop_codon:yes gene_type:complete